MVKEIKDQSAEQKILKAAKQVFFDKGMAGARMQDIADAAGINKALLHYYFRSKEKLFENIFIDATANLFPKLSSILASEKSVFEKIERICIEYINQVQQLPYLPIFILSESARQPETFLKKIWSKQKPPLKAFVDMIETAVRQKVIKPVHPIQLLMNILSLSIFPFMAKPLLQHVTGISKKQYAAMIRREKKNSSENHYSIYKKIDALMKKFIKRACLSVICLLILLLSCHSDKDQFDASGTFETDEVIVSAQLNGQLLSFNIEEGDTLSKGDVVGKIDSTDVVLQKQQVQATIQSLHEKTADVEPQIKLLRDQLAVQQTQLNQSLKDQQRFENMLKEGAVTQRQVDDINTQVDATRKQMQVTQQQINVQRSNTGTQNSSIMSEKDPLQKQVAQLSQQLSKANIVNPLNGTVLTKYAEEGEVTSVGKALYKIADLSYLNLRAYITGAQLSTVKLNQQVQVFIDSGANNYREYTGTVIWISDKAEFTPKTIQTKDERANLVYAIKVRVKNDGYLKIGMYGEVKFPQSAAGGEK